jgi:hypothetical protein
LSVGENGGVVTSEGLFDEVVDFATGIDFTLRGTFIEDVVEVELAVVLPLGYLHLAPAAIGSNAAIQVAVLHLVFEKGSDADARLDLATAAHLIILLGTGMPAWAGREGIALDGMVVG